MKIENEQLLYLKSLDPRCPNCDAQVAAVRMPYDRGWTLYEDTKMTRPHECTKTTPEVMPGRLVTLPGYVRDIFDQLRTAIENDNVNGCGKLIDRLEKFCREHQAEHEQGSEIAGQLAGHYGWEIH